MSQNSTNKTFKIKPRKYYHPNYKNIQTLVNRNLVLINSIFKDEKKDFSPNIYGEVSKSLIESKICITLVLSCRPNLYCRHDFTHKNCPIQPLRMAECLQPAG